jgi:RsiW-degrading membrane proteinase PrsW (M82 family)
MALNAAVAAEPCKKRRRVGEATSAFITGNMRFIGATLLHVSSSAIIGIFMAMSYYKNEYFKQRYLLSGFILSVALHSIFNSFIIRAGNFTVVGFSLVWVSVIIIILMFEKIKYKLKAPEKPTVKKPASKSKR